jgi:phospholipase C
MKASTFGLYAVSAFAIAIILGGCGGPQTPLGMSNPSQQSYSSPAHRARRSGTQWPVQHLIVVIQQSRSFNDLFAGYPGADTQTFGCASGAKSSSVARSMSSSSGCPAGDTKVPLKPVGLANKPCRISASLTQYYEIAWDNGEMDGWNRLDKSRPLCPYTYVDSADTRPYWKLAERFAVADHMFASTRFNAFANQLYLLAGTTLVSRNTFVIGPPDLTPWGCDSPAGNHTIILRRDRVSADGPFPCFYQFPTIADLLDRANVTWRYYYDPPGGAGADWNAFESIKDVNEGPDWSTDMSAPATNVLSDIAGGNLTSVSWVLSPVRDSDALRTHGGPKWVNAIVRAVEKSPYWANTAVVVTWLSEGDGQFYDSVPPPQLDVMGLGFRVPLIAASKFAKHHYVSHEQYEFASILKFIEENWGLPLLGGGATDKRANSISDMFDFGRRSTSGRPIRSELTVLR